MTAESLATRRAPPPPVRPAGGPPWLPVWSPAAALRAVRATLVVPALFALCYEVADNLQLATYAAFGGFATLLMAGFGGSRRDKAIAHLGLGLAGTVLIAMGTAVNSSTVLATAVTIPVVFGVLFAGVAGPAAASGGTAALLAYVLPAASPGTVGMLPDRLAGWWLATVAGTAAVLLLSPRPPEDRLRAAAATSADALAAQLAAALRGVATPDHRAASVQAKHALLDAFTSTPYRPTGLATGDQALASLVGLLEWCTAVLCDSLSEYQDLRRMPQVERSLLEAAEAMLRDIGALVRGDGAHPDLEQLEARLRDSVAHLNDLAPETVAAYAEAVHVSFHARTLAVAVRAAAVDALVASRQADPDLIATQRRRWFGAPEDDERGVGSWLGTGAIALRHASLRSAWFRTSVRGAVGLAAAVAVADVTGVQHGFWVVLGTLSVLRTSATSTGATAWRALLGTVAGFVIGGALILAIGTSTTALWVALPVAVCIAAYAPGVAPFAVGQAGFTVVISVLFNLLAPAGWEIGVIRIEDVAIGCAVSVVVGVLFWPRGAAAVVSDDLADAFRLGGDYLDQSVGWALGLRQQRPDGLPAMAASLRLEDALRGFLAEQGTKYVPKDQLWRLIGGALRLRLTAYSLAGLPHPSIDPDPARGRLGEQSREIARWYGDLAAQLRGPAGADPLAAPAPHAPYPLDDVPDERLSCTLWVGEHLRHLSDHLVELTGPAAVVASRRAAPWWR